jgi:hypothetical protein
MESAASAEPTPSRPEDVDSQNACHFPAGRPGVMVHVSCRVICNLSQMHVIFRASHGDRGRTLTHEQLYELRVLL